MPKYYEISETSARRSMEMMSFREYVPGSATADYRRSVDQAAVLYESVLPKCATESQREKAAYYLDRYAATLAQAINRENQIGASCPSVMIAGPSNFPVRKKEKQIAAFRSNRALFEKADYYLHQLSQVHALPVLSSDPEALEILRHKLQTLEENHQRMKEANTFYRSKKTLDGCPGLTEKERSYLLRPGVFAKGDGSPLALYGQPFPAYALQNSNANIKRTRERLQALESFKAAPALQQETEFYTYKEDTAAMRVQFFFDDKPDEGTRNFLKSHGFCWAPSVGAWQRQLTPAGQSAARAVLEFLNK